MIIPEETVNKFNTLSEQSANLVIALVDSLFESESIKTFFALCGNGSKNPMTEEEISDFFAHRK